MPAVDHLIAELPETERPRERLLAQGSEALSDTELIAILLRSGGPGVSALGLANDLLVEFGGLIGLATCNFLNLRRPGLGQAKAATLLASFELGRRLARAELPRRRSMKRPTEVVDYLMLRYGLKDQEIMGAIFVDSRNQLMAEREIYRGTLNRASVEPREILKEGLLRAAAGFILFHNHPSGDPAPSAQDIFFTRRMAEAGDLIGIRLVDHLILGYGGSWVSLKQRGAW